MLKFVIFLGLIIIIGIGLYIIKYEFLDIETVNNPSLRGLAIRNMVLEIEIADTLAERRRGLSGRTSLDENQGMLFVYNEPGKYSFWMKDIKFPIDIIWIDENYGIVDISKSVSPNTFPQTFQPSSPAKYVLEVNANWADRNFIKIGDSVSF